MQLVNDLSWHEGNLHFIPKPAQELYSNADYDKIQGLWEGVSAGTSDRVPRSQGGASESLKGPIALSIDLLFWFFSSFLGSIFNYF